MKNQMKSSLATWASVLLLGAAVTSCKQELNEVQSEAGASKARVAATIDLGSCGVDTDITSNTTWTSDNEYIIRGYVRVLNGATLTIQAGTVIKGDCNGTLIIERGSRIEANGTESSPIVFTGVNESRGSWGGVVILGRASNNEGPNVRIEGIITVGDPPSATARGYHGPGTFKEDTQYDGESSGSLSYVRIDYAGQALSPNNEINSLTLGSVGSGTLIDHILVRYAGDDAFEFFGGTVNAKYLGAIATQDDDFDTDLGHRGKIQFALALRDRTVADISGSNGIETDNNVLAAANNLPRTSTIFSNVTLLLRGQGDSENAPVAPAFFENGLLLRRGSETKLYNSVFSGWPLSIEVRDEAVTPCETIVLTTSYTFANPWGVGLCNFGAIGLIEYGLFQSSFYPGIPDISTQILYDGTDFSTLDPSFFTPVSFRGASDEFGSFWGYGTPWNPGPFL
ncbi:MAG: hypothetical protein H7Z75_18545 [Ferruginibacter sp.]|nr:hypothetical protein [Cytophagales bacterium]